MYICIHITAIHKWNNINILFNCIYFICNLMNCILFFYFNFILSYLIKNCWCCFYINNTAKPEMGNTLEHVFHLVKVSNIDMGEWKVADTQISSCLLVSLLCIHSSHFGCQSWKSWHLEYSYGASESESDMTCGQVWLPILGICALHLPILSAHTQQWTNTHLEHTPGAVGSHLCLWIYRHRDHVPQTFRQNLKRLCSIRRWSV